MPFNARGLNQKASSNAEDPLLSNGHFWKSTYTMTALNKGGAIDLIMMGFLLGGIANGEVCSGITVFRS